MSEPLPIDDDSGLSPTQLDAAYAAIDDREKAKAVARLDYGLLAHIEEASPLEIATDMTELFAERQSLRLCLATVEMERDNLRKRLRYIGELGEKMLAILPSPSPYPKAGK